jgi:hypothetical protein
MKLTVTKKPFKGKPVGSEIELNDRQARLLTKMGRAQYMTRHIEAAPRQVVLTATPAPAPVAAPAPQEPPPAARVIKVDGADIDLDAMETEELHALAKTLDVKVHHASGAEKVRVALIEAQRAPE